MLVLVRPPYSGLFASFPLALSHAHEPDVASSQTTAPRNAGAGAGRESSTVTATPRVASSSASAEPMTPAPTTTADLGVARLWRRARKPTPDAACRHHWDGAGAVV